MTEPVPPPLPARTIAPPPLGYPGTSIDLPVDGHNLVLHLPPRFRPRESRAITLTVHFHGAPWFGLGEHVRRDVSGPVLAVHLGEGSSVYARPFKDPGRLRVWLDRVEQELRARGVPPSTRISRVNLSSFSAGYGAVRELVQQEEYRRLIRRIVLADSLYAGLQPGAQKRTAADENMNPWVEFVRLAAGGERSLLLSYSQIQPDTYASSRECAEWIARLVGGKIVPVPAGIPATQIPDFPLVERLDQRGLHLWGYAGTTAAAHVTHARHIAELWAELDRVEGSVD